VAVVQISRIQIRRGRENAGTGLPQLASGELGWAVDTQNLYIGNGSVSEGAPYVGNTQILTEKTNLFELADDYTYKKQTGIMQTGIDTNNPTVRSLQDRLDDIVSIKSFGATGDGSDQTEQIQRAIDNLFLNPATKGSERSRVVLHIDPGVYELSDTIYIPPHATIHGAGKDKTVFRITGESNGFTTVNGDSNIGAPASDALSDSNNQARYIEFVGMTIDMTTTHTALLLQSCRNSLFKDIRVKGAWPRNPSREIGASDSTPYQIGIRLDMLGNGTETKENKFINIDIEDFDYGIVSDYDISDNTWENCDLNNLGYGALFGENTSLAISGQFTGPVHNTFTNCIFRRIDRHGINVVNGVNNISSLNKFYSVGNDGGVESNAIYPVINFAKAGNTSVNDYFSRTEDLSYDQTYINNTVYVPEVSGHTIYQNGYSNRLQVLNYSSPERLFRLPAENKKSFQIEYLYVSNQVDAMRQGTLEITCNPTGAGQLFLTDDYDFIGDTGFEGNLILTAQLFDENFDGTLDTVAVKVLNSTTSDNADFYFTVKTKV
jgi:hypothetical protein